MGLYVLKRGKHVEGGVTYDSKDRSLNVVESEDDLVKKFGFEKFGRLESDQFSNQQRKAKSAKKGKKAEDAEPQEDAESEAPQAAPKAAKKGKKSSKPAFGKDVTERFSEASDNGLSVFLEGDVYTVTEADSPDTAVNDDELKTKKAVREFISSYAG